MRQDSFTKFIWFSITLFAFGLLVSWQTAVVLIATIFIHEHGRLFKAHNRGLEAHGICYVPLMGAIAVFKGFTFSRKDDFDIAMGGLSLSTLIVCMFYLWFAFSGEPYFAEITKILIFLNFFFLLPIFNFDGGKIMKSLTFSVSPYIGYFFLSLCVAVFLYLSFSNFLIFFLPYLCLIELKHRVMNPVHKHKMSLGQWFTGVLKLVAVIGLMIWIYGEVEPYEGSGALESLITKKDLLAY